MPEMVKIMQEIRTTYINGHEIPVLISDEKEALLAAKAAGRAIIGLWRPEQEMDAISAAKYVVEDLNDVSEEYLERIPGNNGSFKTDELCKVSEKSPLFHETGSVDPG